MRALQILTHSADWLLRAFPRTSRLWPQLRATNTAEPRSEDWEQAKLVSAVLRQVCGLHRGSRERAKDQSSSSPAAQWRKGLAIGFGLNIDFFGLRRLSWGCRGLEAGPIT
jgi:hypothetical protein